MGIYPLSNKPIPINADDYRKSSTGFGFNTILFQQLASCMYYGTTVGADRESLRKFEHAVKMLESVLVTRLTSSYQEKVKKIAVDCEDAIKKNQLNTYYELLRLRFMYLMEVLDSIPNFMPEEKGMDRISYE